MELNDQSSPASAYIPYTHDVVLAIEIAFFFPCIYYPCSHVL
jgi:hypothetical protein